MLHVAPGDQVEFYRAASSKDISGWHGPATVVDVTSVRDGQPGIKWQGKLLTCRLQDVRSALICLCFSCQRKCRCPSQGCPAPSRRIRGLAVRLGWFRNGARWIPCEANHKYPQTLLCGLRLASCLLGLQGTVSFRLGCQLNNLTPVSCDDLLLVWWPVGRLEEWNHLFLPGNAPICFERICPGLRSPIIFVQFFCEGEETIQSIQASNLRTSFKKRGPPALTDGAVDDPPEHHNIFSPENSEDVRDDRDLDLQDDSPTESVEAMFSRYESLPPPAIADPPPESAYIFDCKEIERQPPQLEISENCLKY